MYCLKVDCFFVKDIGVGEFVLIVEIIVILGNKFGFVIIVEGIEKCE